MNPLRFCGFEADREEARLLVFGAPFDGTASFRPGARFASARMREESWALESYSPRLDLDLTEFPAADDGDLELGPGDVRAALASVEAYCRKRLARGQTPVMLGGEHSLTLAAFRAALDVWPDLHLLHFDAHTDLRDDYLGEPLSHASVLRRCLDLVGPGRIHSFGVRSGLREEFCLAEREVDFHPYDLTGLEATLAGLAGTPLYVTIDLDVLDPSVLPGTGTPEPGGVSFRELEQALHSLQGQRIVAADLMELAPPWDASGRSTAVACKLLRELVLVILS